MKKWPFLCILTLVLLLGTYFFLRKEHKTLLIIGCARSGTAYISKVLQESSLQIKHERMGADGTCSWPLTARPDEKKRRVHLKNFQFSHVFHQVRHPLKAISSIYFTEDRHAWNYILKKCP